MKPTEDRGFTLVEVLVAMVILTVGLVSLAEMMAITIRMQMLGHNETSATRMAQEKMDQLMSLNFDTAVSIQLGGSLTADVANYNDTPEPGYKRRWRVGAGPVDPAPAVSANLRQITVRIIPLNDNRRINMPIDLISVIRRW